MFQICSSTKSDSISKYKKVKNSVNLTLFFCWQHFCKNQTIQFNDYKEMSNKEDIKDEEIIKEQETVQLEENQETEKEVVKEEPSPEELLQTEKDKFLRLFAEFENYKKRTTRERIELFKTAGQEVMTSLLPVVDDFERALSHIEDDKEAEELRKGVLLIYQKFYNTLEQKGLSKIETNQGDIFDAEIHEAITQIPAPSEDLKGKVIDCVEKGYKLGDKIIRYPKVVIGQ